MEIKTILLPVLSLLLIGTNSSYSQNPHCKIAAIDSLIKVVNKVDDFHPPFSAIFTDGQINERRLFGFFKSHKVIGGFAEKYILKDSALIKLWKGSRQYLNNEKTLSSNKIECYIFNNERICYYLESMCYETKGQPDSLVYEIEYYIDNDTILKALKKGTFKHDEASYFNKILIRSKDGIRNKNELYKN